MKHFLFGLSFALFLITSSSILASEKIQYKWGKVDPAEFKEKDSTNTAGAIILFDIGSHDYEVMHGELFLVYRRHMRIKILNKSGYDYANGSIEYMNRGNEEKIDLLEGSCYWLDEKGEVQSMDMDKKMIFDENVNDIYHKRKFTVPGIKEGCIIEFKYRIVSSEILTLRSWSFQYEIPARYSELSNSIPRYFVFQPVQKGTFPIQRKDAKNSVLRAHIHHVPTATDALKGADVEDYEIEMQVDITGYFAKNVPALEEEPFISSLNNYDTSIDFYLTLLNLPAGLRREYANTWKFYIERLYKDDYFGSRLKENSFADITKSIVPANADDQAKAAVIYNYVSSNVSWTGVHTFFAGDKLKTVLEDHKGNSGEINLLLLVMLREAGIKASPVLTSTRDHGYVDPYNPSLRQFNHVIVAMTGDQGTFFLDATDPYRAPGNLDENHLNGSGMIAEEATQDWVVLKSKDKPRSLLMVTSLLGADGMMELTCDKTYYGYPASCERRNIGRSMSQTDYLNKKLTASISDVSVLENSFENVELLNKQLKSHVKYKTRQFCSDADGSLYVLPMADFGLKENPFSKESRKLPVEFAEPFEETYIVNLTIPSDYTVKELPKSEAIKLPEDAAVFTYIISAVDAVIQLKCTLKLNNTYYTTEEYEDLKEFFSRILAKQNERVVITKR